MKNTTKFGIGIILAISLLMTGISIMATDAYNEKEVIFVDNSIFTDEEKEHITAVLTEECNTHETYGLKCTLFGHTYKTEYVTAITHKVSATSPRCLREIYETKICEDCSDTQAELINSAMIACCN